MFNAINFLQATERSKAHLQRREAIKLPSSRGLCLKVTLGGQIDGISDGANGLGLGIRQAGRTEQYTAAYLIDIGSSVKM